MPTINDYKKKALNAAGYSGDINTAEYKWLRAQVSPYKGSIPDMWMKFLYNRGFTTGPLPYRLSLYLKSLGYTGSLPNMLYQYWKNGAAPAWAAGSNLWVNFVLNGLNGDTSYAITDTHGQTIYAQNSAGLYLPFAANVLTKTDLGLQTVPTRTNLVLRSQEFDNATWTKAATTVTADVGVAPDGTTTADRVSATAAFASVYQTITVAASTQYTASIFVKKVNFKDASILSEAGGGFGGWFATADLDAGTVSSGTLGAGTAFTGISATLTSVGNGWWRLTCTFTTPAGFSSMLTRVWTGAYSGANNTGKDIDWWGAQIEVGAFASPPIPTTTATVTVNGNQQIISSLGTQLSTGVAGMLQFNSLQSGASDIRAFTINDGTSTNLVQITWDATSVNLLVTAGGVAQGGVQLSNSQGAAGISTIAFVASSNYIMGRIVGGSTPSPDTVATWPVIDRVAFGGFGHTASNNLFSVTRKVALDFLTPSDDPATKFTEWYAKAQLA